MTTALAPDPRPTKLPRKERRALEELLWRGVAADPLTFLGACRTFDEHAERLRAFPVCAICARDEGANERVRVLGEPPDQVSVCAAHGREHKPYFRPLTRTWAEAEIIPIEKSRQLMVSWWAVAVHLWLAMTRPSLIAFQSLNGPKACELLNRAALLYRTLPKELQRFGPLTDAPKSTARKIEDRIEFQHELDGRRVPSRILAIPNGPHHVRMFTFTAVFIDEASVWEADEDFEESYTAALATVKGGGKLTAVGTVNDAGRFFFRLCRGEV